MLDYFSRKRQSQQASKGKATGSPSENVKQDAKPTSAIHRKPVPTHEDLVLNDEDEAFLQRIVSEEGPPPPLPERHAPAAERPPPKDAQVVLMQGANLVPLPDAPDTPEGEVATSIEGEAVQMAAKDKQKKEEEDEEAAARKKKNRFSWLRRASSRSTKRADKAAAGESLQEASQSLKPPVEGQTVARTGSAGDLAAKDKKGEGDEEQDEMASVLEQLNLAAVNNRVFSISDESKDLLKKFNLVLQDLVNGVPTAYHDLESLLTNSDEQISKVYESLPSFLQELIEKLPEKVTGKLGAEAAAASATATATAAEGKHETDSKKKEGGGSASSTAKYLASGASAASKLLKVKVPSLRELVAKQGSVVALLRSVVAALRTRFPALMGVNAVWSVALFVLLFIFWYCHKRGRDVRLEKERRLTEAEEEEIRRRVAADPAWAPPAGWLDNGGGGGATTRAPVGADIEAVRAGMLRGPNEVEEGEAEYAPGGSLAKAIKEGEVEEK